MDGPRCGGRGWDQGGIHAPPIATLVGFTRSPWNKGQLIGQKRPLKPKEVWAIRVRLQLERRRARPRVVQSRHRQQAARLRPRAVAR